MSNTYGSDPSPINQPPTGPYGQPDPGSGPPYPEPKKSKAEKYALFGCLGLAGLLLISIIACGFLGALMPRPAKEANAPAPGGAGAPSTAAPAPAAAQPEQDGMKIYKTNEDVTVGYMSYHVYGSWYTKHISKNPYIDKPPDAMYLIVDLGAANGDKEARTIPPFKLIDESKSEYDVSQNAWTADGSIGLVTDLNPGVAKRAYVIFDVPTSHKYKLKASGGYWSSENALVELAPTTK